MRPTTTERTPKPGSPRYSTVTIDDHGEHVLRGPTFSGANTLRRLIVTARDGSPYPEGSQGHMEYMSPAMAASVGACWFHEGLDLDAACPSSRASLDDWMAYGEAVCDELLEHGYTLVDLLTLYNGAAVLISNLHTVIGAAQERADFSEGPEESASPDPVTSGAEDG
jgi:hypothetical protein